MAALLFKSIWLDIKTDEIAWRLELNKKYSTEETLDNFLIVMFKSELSVLLRNWICKMLQNFSLYGKGF
jgi:hypothetical protein